MGENLKTNSCQREVGPFLRGGMKIPVTSVWPRCRLMLGSRLGSPVLAMGLVNLGSVGRGQEGSWGEWEGFPFPCDNAWPIVAG